MDRYVWADMDWRFLRDVSTVFVYIMKWLVLQSMNF